MLECDSGTFDDDKLTDKSLLAEVLRLLEIVLPLEQGKSLVNQRQNIDSHGLDLFLHVDGLVELLNGLGEVLLVEQELTVVVVDIRNLLKILQRSPEGSHGGCDRAHLVLSYTKLNVGVDKGTIEVNRLLVVLGGFRELSEDEVELSTVIVDVRVILVVGNGELEVISGGILVSYKLLERRPKQVISKHTKLKVQAGTLDVALHQGWLQLNTLVKISQSTLGITLKVSEGGPHVKRQSLKFTQVTKFQSLLEGSSSLLVAVTSLLADTNQSLAQLSLARFLGQIFGLLKTLGERLRTETLEIVGDEGGAGELLALGLEDGLTFVFRNLLQKSLEGVTAHFVGETVHNAAGGEIEESFAVLLEVLVGNGATVQGLDVPAVHLERGGGILHDLFPFRHDIVAGGTVGIVDGIGLANDSLSIEFDSSVVVFGAVGFVTGGLQLAGV